jgi:hypothetical protein
MPRFAFNSKWGRITVTAPDKAAAKAKITAEVIRRSIGRIAVRTSRITGFEVEVIDARQAPDFDEDVNERWLTVCRGHATVCSHTTRKLALDHAGDPREWCEPCGNGEPADPDLENEGPESGESFDPVAGR